MEIIRKDRIGTMLDTSIKNKEYYIGYMEDFEEFIKNIELDLVEQGNDEVLQGEERKIPLDNGARIFKLYGNECREKYIYYKKFLDEDGKNEIYEFCEIY